MSGKVVGVQVFVTQERKVSVVILDDTGRPLAHATFDADAAREHAANVLACADIADPNPRRQ